MHSQLNLFELNAVARFEELESLSNLNTVGAARSTSERPPSNIIRKELGERERHEAGSLREANMGSKSTLTAYRQSEDTRSLTMTHTAVHSHR